MTWMDTKSGNFVLKLSIPFWNQKNQILSPLLFGTYEFQQRVGFFLHGKLYGERLGLWIS